MYLFLLLLPFCLVTAESGIDAWLRFAPLPNGYSDNQVIPSNIYILNTSDSSPVNTAGNELKHGIQSIFGQSIELTSKPCNASSTIVVGTVDQYRRTCGPFIDVPQIEEDGFWLSIKNGIVHILGQNERGSLYGTFEYLSMLAQANFSEVAYATSPNGQVRWVNQWDNLDGSIERGYGGPSIFFENGMVTSNLTRAAQYARLLASIRINGVVVNNVNANSSLLRNLDGLKRIADIFRPYGVQLGISLNFASPMDFGLSTYDPLDPNVIAFWTNITSQLYQQIPDMAGYLVKANSEGQPGPLTCNRTLAQGANLFAKALQPHGGIVAFRAFVYNLLNESDWKADRANAAVQFFKDLDGQFDDNGKESINRFQTSQLMCLVLVQIKYGPIDFQVREPASPLFANLLHTNTAIELEVTQEYLGQQCHLVYLPPLWKTVLDFDLRVENKTSLVRDIVSGQRFNRSLGGSAAVVNVGTK